MIGLGRLWSSVESSKKFGGGGGWWCLNVKIVIGFLDQENSEMTAFQVLFFVQITDPSTHDSVYEDILHHAWVYQ